MDLVESTCFKLIEILHNIKIRLEDNLLRFFFLFNTYFIISMRKYLRTTMDSEMAITIKGRRFALTTMKSCKKVLFGQRNNISFILQFYLYFYLL